LYKRTYEKPTQVMNGPCSISWKLCFIIGYEIINLISPISTHLTFKLANQINCESSL